VVRNYEERQARDAVVLLETHMANEGDTRRRLRLERAIVFAGALVEQLLREHYSVTFETFMPDLLSLSLSSRSAALPGRGL
jgi:uncharacterized protein (DUF58 family)